MLNTAYEVNENLTAALSQNETLPSDDEIAQRVLEIRSQWDLKERISRRDEAERRFSDLIQQLTESIAA
ncbi:MAG: hypothetical protein AAF958_11720 [Planctomycetota bacterium]